MDCGASVDEAANEDSTCWYDLCCKGELAYQGEQGSFGAFLQGLEVGELL